MEESARTRTKTTVGGAIVKLPTEHYRQVAQNHWGLTDKQMEGMHVHHRIPQSEGGTNDPSNLYVCSPWFHAYVWHTKQYWIEKATEAGRKSLTPEQRRNNGLKTGNARTHEQMKKMWETAARSRSVPIILTKDGIDYYCESRNSAAREYGLSRGAISRVLKGELNHHHGYTVRYA